MPPRGQHDVGPALAYTRVRVTNRLGAILLLACALSWGGCGDPAGVVPPDSDGGTMGDGGGPPPGAHGVVVLMDPAVEGPSTPIARFHLQIQSIRLASDRGPALDPVIDSVPPLGDVDVPAGGLELAFDGVPPALYSSIEMTLAGPGPVLELVFTDEHMVTWTLRTNDTLVLDARCEHGTAVTVTDTLRMGFDFALNDAIEAATHTMLPPPPGSAVTLDDASAPTAIAAFRTVLQLRVHAECGPDMM